MVQQTNCCGNSNYHHIYLSFQQFITYYISQCASCPPVYHLMAHTVQFDSSSRPDLGDRLHLWCILDVSHATANWGEDITNGLLCGYEWSGGLTGGLICGALLLFSVCHSHMSYNTPMWLFGQKTCKLCFDPLFPSFSFKKKSEKLKDRRLILAEIIQGSAASRLSCDVTVTSSIQSPEVKLL